MIGRNIYIPKIPKAQVYIGIALQKGNLNFQLIRQPLVVIIEEGYQVPVGAGKRAINYVRLPAVFARKDADARVHET